MAQFIEPEYLQPPHVQLGFFWSRVHEVTAYRNVLRWLLAHNYRMHPVVTAMRPRAGKLPRFNQLATHGLPEDSVFLRGDVEAADLLGNTEWLPVLVRLIAEDELNVDIDLNYALIQEESFSAGEPHAIERVASGADLNLLDNSAPEYLDTEIVRNLHRTKQWQENVFRCLCDKLQPDYAGSFWEWELQPPRSLAASGEPRNFCDLYLSDELLQQTPGVEDSDVFSAWSVHRFAAGSFFAPRGQLDSQRTKAGAAMLRQLVVNRYLGNRT